MLRYTALGCFLLWISTVHSQSFDITYHRLELTVNPAVRYIRGTVTTYFKPQSDAFRQLYFDLDKALEVTSVRFQNQDLGTFRRQNDRLVIDLPATVAKGKTDSVSVSYQGVPPQNGFGSFVQTDHSGTPIIWTLSEPYGARDWWPNKQDLYDKIDKIDLIVRAPSGNRVAGNGKLLSERNDGNDVIFHWQTRYPTAAYLVAFAVTNYSAYSDFVPVPGKAPIEVLNYVYPEKLETSRQQTPRIIPIMQLYNERFGLYPFASEKYGHAQFGFGGGMEHQTMSFMAGFSHSLMAHELAHQWFGDKVTTGSWQDIWLNEGFATYLDGLTYENGLGGLTFQNWLVSRIASVVRQPDGSVWVDDTTSVSRIFSGRLSYDKGAMLLHMLRWKLGDEAFFQAVRNYLNDPALAYGFARTEDLQRHLEATGKKDLDEFFRDWFYGQGYPSYFISWSQQPDGRLRLKAEQSSSHPSVAFFEMPIPVQLTGKNKDTTVVLDHRFSGQSFDIPVAFAVESVTFDPKHWILSANNVVTFVSGNEPSPGRERRIRLYPVPVRDILFIGLENWDRQPRLLRVFDAAGRLVAQSAFEPQLSTGNLPAGFYLLQVVGEDGTEILRFVKEQ